MKAYSFTRGKAGKDNMIKQTKGSRGKVFPSLQKMARSKNCRIEMIISTVSCLADYPLCSRPPLFICPMSNMHSTSPGQRVVADLLPITDPVEVDESRDSHTRTVKISGFSFYASCMNLYHKFLCRFILNVYM